MSAAKFRMAAWTGSLSAIGAGLVAFGVRLIGEGDLIAGGILCGIGAVMLIIADYIGR